MKQGKLQILCFQSVPDKSWLTLPSKSKSYCSRLRDLSVSRTNNCKSEARQALPTFADHDPSKVQLTADFSQTAPPQVALPSAVERKPAAGEGEGGGGEGGGGGGAFGEVA